MGSMPTRELPSVLTHTDCQETNRIVTRFGDWKLRPDGPRIVPARYVLSCVSEDEDGTMCGETSQPSADVGAVAEWARTHAWLNQDHRSYSLDAASAPMVLVPDEEPA
ncbi:hypothetical protein [Kitasatospora sp. NPDC048407]|uniref:DUF7848 domain-containing protein n=1 Tax=Kitasatospora sp. NPDC048407 TaxID=3364051 RepID=UPI00372051C8